MTQSFGLQWGNFVAVLSVGLFGLFTPLAAQAAPSEAPELSEALVQSAEALKADKPSQAIVLLETLADRGIVHPDLSYNRGLAYAARAKTSQAQTGDWGQAAAGLAEALSLSPKDEETSEALRNVQLLVAQKRAGDKSSSESESLGLIEKALHSLSMFWLFSLGATGSLAICAGIWLRLQKNPGRRLTGEITLGLGLLTLLSTSLLSLARTSLFAESKRGVTIVEHAQLVGSDGRTRKGTLPLREGTIVHIGPQVHGIAPLVSLGEEQFLRTSQIRILRDE
jgi:hypothetical protein